MALTFAHTAPAPAVLDVRVDGPECAPLDSSDLRRLFPGSSLNQQRLDRLTAWPRVVVAVAGRVAAVATCHKFEGEMRVPDLAIDVPAAGRLAERDVLNALLDAVELAAVAGGCRRVVLTMPKISPVCLERRGYVRINERCAGGWLEKQIA
jgi:hypothetical protein